jgi:hypothetical protein
MGENEMYVWLQVFWEKWGMSAEYPFRIGMSGIFPRISEGGGVSFWQEGQQT